MCGRLVSLKVFNPNSLDLDIYLQDVKGLGRGRGFKVVGRRSARQIPSITEMVKDRVLRLGWMLYDDGVLTREDLTQTFPVYTLEQYQGLEEELDSSKAEVDESVKGLVSQVAEALEEDPEDWEVEDQDDGFAVLEFGLRRLIEDRDALKAELEEK